MKLYQKLQELNTEISAYKRQLKTIIGDFEVCVEVDSIDGLEIAIYHSNIGRSLRIPLKNWNQMTEWTKIALDKEIK